MANSYGWRSSFTCLPLGGPLEPPRALSSILLELLMLSSLLNPSLFFLAGSVSRGSWTRIPRTLWHHLSRQSRRRKANRLPERRWNANPNGVARTRRVPLQKIWRLRCVCGEKDFTQYSLSITESSELTTEEQSMAENYFFFFLNL